tara:strand:- start:4963 stop:6066 length:1104 start_codon:yes stop_codon:yes gene_type:complete
MKTKKLIIFMPSIEGGGADKNLFIITNYLIEKFDNIQLITSSIKYKKTFNKKINFLAPQMAIWSKFGRNLKNFISLIILIKTLIKNKHSIVLSFQANLYAIIVCKIFSIRIITRSNSFPNDWARSRFKKFLFKKIYKLADARIVNSIGSKKKFLKQYNLSTFCIYNPLNLKEIIKLSNIRKKRLFNKKASLKLIFVGRLSSEKDPLTFLKSILYLKNKINLSVLIIGEGILKQKLLLYVKRNNLNGIIKLIGYKKNPYPYIKQSNFLVLTSLHEGLPNILLEAMALKKFVISSNCETGPKEILFNGKAGGLFKVKNYVDLSNKILFFYNHKKVRNKKIKFGYSKINRFDKNKNLHSYLKVIKILMNK